MINHGEPAESARIVATWIDGEGQVLATDEVGATCLAPLDTGATCDFLFAVDASDVGSRLIDARLLLWGIAT